MWFKKYFEIILIKIWFIQVGYSSMIYMIHSSSDYVMWCDLCDLENTLKLFWKKYDLFK